MIAANNRRISQKSLVLASLLFIAASGIALPNGISTFYSNNQVQAQQQAGQIKINKLWETPGYLKNPESVAYAPKQNVLFLM
ncbi:MAG TPA: hypothetical protein VFJ51_08820 [Nitrososphaeraceae archaeon]|nr:hypothetical protein [Nitrososphaeraceae archaeon]